MGELLGDQKELLVRFGIFSRSWILDLQIWLPWNRPRWIL